MFVERAAQVPHITARLRSWPSELCVGDLFTGAGTFVKVIDAIIHGLRDKFPRDAAHLCVLGLALVLVGTGIVV